MVIAIAHYRLLMQSVKGLSFGACVPECQPSLFRFRHFIDIYFTSNIYQKSLSGLKVFAPDLSVEENRVCPAVVKDLPHTKIRAF